MKIYLLALMIILAGGRAQAEETAKYLTCSDDGRLFTVPLVAGESTVTTGDQTIEFDDESLLHFSATQLLRPKYSNSYKYISFYMVCSSKTPDPFASFCTPASAGKKWMSVGFQSPDLVTNDVTELEFKLGSVDLKCQLN